jgi:hypothetical protein
MPGSDPAACLRAILEFPHRKICRTGRPAGRSRIAFARTKKESCNMRLLTMILALLCSLTLPATVRSQEATKWPDQLVEHMIGEWKLSGDVMGGAAHHEVHAEWVLNRAFLLIHEKTSSDAPASERRYDAYWYLGYDPVSERYVLHLLDLFGGRFSETLGYGTLDGNKIRFVFEYPDGPFHTTFSWNAENGTWEWLMGQKDKDGKWGAFAHLKLARAATE